MNLAEAYLAISEKIPIDDIKVKQRLDRAYDIVRANGSGYTVTRYNTIEGDKYRIHRASTQLLENNEAVYTTTEQSCTCPDYEKCRAGLCKHRLAVMMLVAMQQCAGCNGTGYITLPPLDVVTPCSLCNKEQ